MVTPSYKAKAITWKMSNITNVRLPPLLHLYKQYITNNWRWASGNMKATSLPIYGNAISDALSRHEAAWCPCDHTVLLFSLICHHGVTDFDHVQANFGTLWSHSRTHGANRPECESDDNPAHTNRISVCKGGVLKWKTWQRNQRIELMRQFVEFCTLAS